MENKADSQPRRRKSEYLYGIVEKTRKARMNSERRLLELDLFVRHVNVYYACLTTALTVASIRFANSSVLPTLSALSAVLLTIWTMYTSSQNYALKAMEMRTCYLDLQKLLFDMDRPQSDPLSCDEDAAGDRYHEILKRSENHTSEDYFQKEGAVILGCRLGHPQHYYWKRIAAYGIPTTVCAIVIVASIAVECGYAGW